MESLHLEGLTYPHRHLSHMACVLGAARYLGSTESEAWLYGASGCAFFSHAAEDGMCYSYPTDWNEARTNLRLQNAGVLVEPVRVAEDQEGGLVQAVKQLLEQDVPVFDFSGVEWENVLVRGFADTPEGETVRYLFYESGVTTQNQYHPWSKLPGPERVSLCGPSDDRTTAKHALDGALEMNREPNPFKHGDVAMGYDAFRCAAEWLGREEKLEADFGYNIQVWEECRHNAVAFFAEASTRLKDEGLTEPFRDLGQHFGDVHEELKAIAGTFGDTIPEGMHEDYARRLRNAYEAERSAIASAEAVLAAM